MSTQWFYNEDKMGEDKYSSYIAVTDTFYAQFTDVDYTGFDKDLDIEKRFVFHSYIDKGPDGYRCKNRKDALDRFSGLAKVDEWSVPHRYKLLLNSFEEIFTKSELTLW